MTDDNHGMTMKEILTELNRYGITAERKSMYDDFLALNQFGISVESKRENGVRYYIGDREFELPELKLLVDAVQSSKFITRKKSEELIRKIVSLGSKYEAGQLNRQVYVANRIKTMNESIYYNVDYIHTAITANQQISFIYFDWNAKKEKQLRRDGNLYVVSPWALTWDDDNYYLVAFEAQSGGIKHFRVDKMLHITVLDDHRQGREWFSQFDMAVYSKKMFGMFGGDERRVTLECDRDLAGVLIDRFGKDIILTETPTGLKVTVSVFVSPVFLSWVWGFSPRMKITSPHDVVDEMKGRIRQSAQMYP